MLLWLTVYICQFLRQVLNKQVISPLSMHMCFVPCLKLGLCNWSYIYNNFIRDGTGSYTCPYARQEGIWGCGSTTPLILDLNTRWKWVVTFALRGEKAPIHIECDAGCVPKPVCALQKSQKFILSAENGNPGFPALNYEIRTGQIITRLAGLSFSRKFLLPVIFSDIGWWNAG